MFFLEGLRESQRNPANASRSPSVTEAGTALSPASTLDENPCRPWFSCPDSRAVRRAGTCCNRPARGWQAAPRWSASTFGARLQAGRLAAHARSESARRVSDCVTALLRDQPFFGSLALSLPIRADETRETLASDGKDIRYAPQWVADTDADQIKTALARVVPGLCAQASHPAERPRPGALATGLAAGHPRTAAGRGLCTAARGRGLGRHQRRASLRPASRTVRRCRGSGRCLFIQRCG